MAGELLLLSGNAHPELAESVAAQLGIKPVGAIVGSFPDGETRVRIEDNVREEDVFVLQPTGPPVNQNIMESLVMIDALKRASAGRITAVMPYFGYARQDRKDTSRVPITARLAVDLFVAAGADRLLAVDLHSAQIQGFADIPFDHLYGKNVLADALKDQIEDPVVVAPDISAGKMARGFAGCLDTDWAIVDKDRIDGKTTRVTGMIGDVAGRNALIVDDIASTAGSLLTAAGILKQRGAERVVAVATHGVLCDGAVGRVERSDHLDHLYVTDSLPPPPADLGSELHEQAAAEKITRITIAPLLAKAITNIHNGRSVSELF